MSYVLFNFTVFRISKKYIYQNTFLNAINPKVIIFVSNNDTKKHKIMIAEIQKYIEIQNNIDEILKNSPFKMSYIIEKSGIKKPTFFKKLKEKRFTPEELLVISKTIEPKQWRNETKEEILESLRKTEEDFKNGKGIPGEIVLENMRKRIEKYKEDALRNS